MCVHKMCYLKFTQVSLILASLMLSQTTIAQANTTLSKIELVSGTDTAMPADSGSVYATDDTTIAFDVDSENSTTNNPLGSLEGAGIDGYDALSDFCGEAIYSLDNTAIINAEPVRSNDVFKADGSILLDASAAGIKPGININALSRQPGTCFLVISVDTITELGSVVYKPDDLIKWTSASGFSLYYSTSLGADIDALQILSSNRILVSFDVSKNINGLSLHDESIIEIDTQSGDINLAFEPLVYSESWAAADLTALSAQPAFDDLIFIDDFE